MRNRGIIPIALLLLMLASSRATAAVSHVRVKLLADVSKITAGKKFTLGVRLSIDPAWHIYWKSPGDSGSPTKVKFDLPDGFSAGELQYPTPDRFDQAGDIVSLGYENSVILLAEITPPRELPKDFSGDFKAEVSWLVCSEVCIPGTDTASLTLAESDSPAPDNADIFSLWRAQLPVEISASPDAAKATASGEIKPAAERASGTIVLEIDWKHPAPANIQFLPGDLDIYNIMKTNVDSQGNKTKITLKIDVLTGKTITPATLEAVIGYKTTDGSHRGFITTIALPKADGKSG